MVLSKKAHARIISIDDAAARSCPGFEGLFVSKNVPGGNDIGAIIHDEELFASDVVTCVGQVWWFTYHTHLHVTLLLEGTLLFSAIISCSCKKFQNC